jgi:uncharacterized integral membrane protein
VKLLTVVVISMLALLSLFALLNWSAVVTPAPLSIGFTTVNAPLGLIMLSAAGLLTAAFLAFIVYQQGVALVEARRSSRDLHAQAELAEKAEVSRFTDLRAYLESELRKIDERSAAARADASARLDRLEGVILGKLAESENGLSAHVAEVEDKIDRVLQVKTS